MDNPKTESCTQIDVRYYLQCMDYMRDWSNSQRFPRGFKSERNALRTLKKVRERSEAICIHRVIKQTRTIGIKTTTNTEVLDV